MEHIKDHRRVAAGHKAAETRRVKYGETNGIEPNQGMLAFLRSFVAREGRFPATFEICAGTERSSASTINRRLRILADLGHVRQIGPARAYVLAAQPGCCAACGQQVPEPSGLT